jgi:hypothetical protein
MVTPPRIALLQRYLDEVGAHLEAPPRRREQELSELALHLNALTHRNEQLGLDGPAAAAAAVEAFGEPALVARELSRAYRRERRRDQVLMTVDSLGITLFAAAIVPYVDAWFRSVLGIGPDVFFLASLGASFALRWLRDRDDLRRWPRSVYAFDGTVERYTDPRRPQVTTLFGGEPPR